MLFVNKCERVTNRKFIWSGLCYDAIIIFEILQIIGSLYFFCYVPHCLQALVCSFSRFKRAGIEGPTPTMFMTTSKKCLKRLAWIFNIAILLAMLFYLLIWIQLMTGKKQCVFIMVQCHFTIAHRLKMIEMWNRTKNGL